MLISMAWGRHGSAKNLNGNNGSVNSGDSCYGQQVLLLLQQGYAACFLISVSALMTGWLGT